MYVFACVLACVCVRVCMCLCACCTSDNEAQKCSSVTVEGFHSLYSMVLSGEELLNMRQNILHGAEFFPDASCTELAIKILASKSAPDIENFDTSIQLASGKNFTP